MEFLTFVSKRSDYVCHTSNASCIARKHCILVLPGHTCFSVAGTRDKAAHHRKMAGLADVSVQRPGSRHRNPSSKRVHQESKTKCGLASCKADQDFLPRGESTCQPRRQIFGTKLSDPFWSGNARVPSSCQSAKEDHQTG